MLDALGQYRRRDGQIVAEPTKVLLIVHGPDARSRGVGPGAPRRLPPTVPAGVGAPDREPRPRRILTGQALATRGPGPSRRRRSPVPGRSGEGMAPSAPPGGRRNGHVQTIWGPLFRTDRLPLRRERLSTPDGDFVDLDWLDGDPAARRTRRRSSCSTASRARRALTTCPGSSGPGGRRAGTRVAFNFRSCSGELNSSRASTTRARRATSPGWSQALVARAPGVADRRRRRLARRQRPPQVARGGGRGGAGGAPWGGRDLGPLRRGRLRTGPRPRIPPPRLRRQLPEDDALEGHREGAAVSGLRRRGGDAPGANVRPVRPGRHRAAERLPGRGRLLDAGLQRPLPRADPPADPPPRRPRRPHRARAHPAGSSASSRRTSAPSSPHAAATPGSSRAGGPGARAPGRSDAPSSS